MHSPITHQQLVEMAFLYLLAFALWFAGAPFWRRTGNRFMYRLSQVVSVLCSCCAGVFLIAWAVYGLVP